MTASSNTRVGVFSFSCSAAAGCSQPEVRLNGEAQEFRWLPPAAAMQLKLNTPTRVLLEAVMGAKH